ncbi:hypothetical protein [Bifidobacterium pseudocatenulatum]|jgi:hypothetical protein|uniref:hypothetical protein n=3 Tax=Bifidobacterium TaxID=1678 RepID=UPI0015FAB860|nr:hypothetical protein [Bifidobacterium pseudocatenulatum]MCB4894280.1 hypothetical protein [Bifidobacterium pseudocatenulatum]MCB4911594.1 hypothetical protein [Bifidobacterium pseudocatenulatum]UDG89416.1 hypothetical protein KYE73_05560 [Bifidobacterium pseudocatenulatum]GDZ04650.1 hypothetical protein MCC01992_19490 [Bifidobacteriaceae bacterium MCC01992]
MFDVISLLVRLARLLAGFLERPGRGRHARIPVRPVWAGLLLDWLAAVLDWLERLVG